MVPRVSTTSRRTRSAAARQRPAGLAAALLAASLSTIPAHAAASAAAGTALAPSPSRPVAVAFCTAGPAWLTPLAGCCAGLPGAAGLHETAMQAERDPETGGWGLPSLVRDPGAGWPEAAAVSRRSDDLVEEFLPGAGVMMHLRGRFQTLSMASRTSRGDLHLGCAESPLGLFEWLRHDAPAQDTAGWPEE